MGRSSETFNKKENEKKKQKRQKDKELKKEERRAAGGSGKKSFEDMLAYVDENGNIIDSPPDPALKKKINAEDIEIGVQKQEDNKDEGGERKGTISFFNDSKGYGFIKDEHGNSVFVHINGLVDRVSENDKVIFEVEMGHKGLNAVNVRLAQ